MGDQRDWGVINTRCDDRSCHPPTLSGSIKPPRVPLRSSAARPWFKAVNTQKIKTSSSLEKGIKRYFSFNRRLRKVRGSADITTDHRTLSAPRHLLWRCTATLENRNSIHERRAEKKENIDSNPIQCVCNDSPRDVYFSSQQQNPVTWRWKWKDDIISDLIPLTVWVDLSPSHLVLPFLVSSGMIGESKLPLEPLGKRKIYFFGGKKSCFLNQGVWYTYWSKMRVGLIPRPVSFL